MLRRALLSHAPRQRVLQQSRYLTQTTVSPLVRSRVQSVKPSALAAIASSQRLIAETEHTWQQATQGQALRYWRSAAMAAGACGAWTLLEDQEPVACAGSSNKGDGEDPVEQVKKKVQELSTIAIAQLAALLPEDYSNLQKKVDEFLASGKGGQITWGFCMGGCAGFAMKKVSKLGAVAVGTLFILLQVASYSGYVDVDYKKIERDVMNYLDINKDGVFDTKDLDSMYKSLMTILEFNLPAGSGFAAGFMLGYRSG